MKKKATALVVSGALFVAGCTAPTAAVVSGAAGLIAPSVAAAVGPVPVGVQKACTVLSWGLPLVQPLITRLVPNDKGIVGKAAALLNDCATGNVVQGVEDVAAGLVSILYAKH